MKQLLGIFIAVVLIPASSAFAHIGGPFSNDSYYEDSTDGIYEAVATMSNGVGVYRFAVRNHSLSAGAATGAGVAALTDDSNVNFGNSAPDAFNHTWYYKGVVYGGSCYGIANESMGIVSATGNATTFSGIAVTTATGAVVSSSTFTIGPQGGNVIYANSSWIAEVTQEYPVIRFSGKGQVSFLGEVDDETRTITFTDVSSREVESTTDGSSPSGSTDTTITESTSATTTTTTTSTSSGGEDAAFSQQGHLRKFKVFGSRVSNQVFP